MKPNFWMVAQAADDWIAMGTPIASIEGICSQLGAESDEDKQEVSELMIKLANHPMHRTRWSVMCDDTFPEEGGGPNALYLFEKRGRVGTFVAHTLVQKAYTQRRKVRNSLSLYLKTKARNW